MLISVLAGQLHSDAARLEVREAAFGQKDDQHPLRLKLYEKDTAPKATTAGHAGFPFAVASLFKKSSLEVSTVLSTYGEREVRKPMTIETMAREFRYDGVRLPDPNPKLSIEEVRTAFSATYPEIATAAVTGPEAVGNKLVYHFAKAIEIRGALAFFAGSGVQASCL